MSLQRIILNRIFSFVSIFMLFFAKTGKSSVFLAEVHHHSFGKGILKETSKIFPWSSEKLY